jgi:geranylgeranyl pyrophosphate synthase
LDDATELLREPASGAESALVQVIRAELEADQLDRTLDSPGERLPDRLWAAALGDPLCELLGRPGKDFRSRLVEAAYGLSCRDGLSRPMPERLPLLVEALHTGSLIVDDIQDGSSYRRGKPSLHVLVGVPLALNAGNWLYFLPHRLLEDLALEAGIELELRRALDRGALRCHYGQALDLGMSLGSLSQREVPGVVQLCARLKTGSLLEMAAEVGAIAGRASPRLERELALFGRSYGVALQMLDDVSGLYQLGRAHKGHEDLLNGRPTWPWAWLSERLSELSYSRLQHQAREVEERRLHPELLAKEVRRHLGDSPYRAVHAELERALERVKEHVVPGDALELLSGEVARLERAYV